MPVLECVSSSGTDAYVAHFGYVNGNSEPVTITISSRNRFAPSPSDRGQPTSFQPGQHHSVFSVSFDGSPLNWLLDGNQVQARGDSPVCP